MYIDLLNPNSDVYFCLLKPETLDNPEKNSN